METTKWQPIMSFRKKITVIEAVELTAIVFLLWRLDAYQQFVTNYFSGMISPLIVLLLVLGSWAIYNGYIRLARALDPSLDWRMRITVAVMTYSYTLWTWLILDVNRFLIAKLFYCGEAPVEYAWSVRSKLRRKEWELANKSKPIH